MNRQSPESGPENGNKNQSLTDKTKAIIGEVLTEIPNLPCSYTSQYKEKWHFRNKTFF